MIDLLPKANCKISTKVSHTSLTSTCVEKQLEILLDNNIQWKNKNNKI